MSLITIPAGDRNTYSMSRAEWLSALHSLPATPNDGIPAFFFGHGSPLLLVDGVESGPPFGHNMKGKSSPLASFLTDFGPVLLEKYRPRGIVVFSAHWETEDEILGAVSATVYTITPRND
jgi:aromatic ring-opening dioxygenase catalytic subunit (LigB family)